MLEVLDLIVGVLQLFYESIGNPELLSTRATASYSEVFIVRNLKYNIIIAIKKKKLIYM